MTITSPATQNLITVLSFVRAIELELIYLITDSERQTPANVMRSLKEMDTASEYLQRIADTMVEDARYAKRKSQIPVKQNKWSNPKPQRQHAMYCEGNDGLQ